MLARCAHCQNTFETDRFGVQACPHCGKQVHLADPAAPPPGPEIEGAAAPFVKRRELGFFRAFVETWKLAALQPTAFFRAVRISDVGAAVLFGVVTLTVSSWFQTLYAGLMGAATRGALEEMLRQMPHGTPLGNAWVMRWVSGGSVLGVGGQLVGAPFLALVALLASAGVFHVMLLALRGAPRGFPATLTVVGYASAAHIVGAAPVPLLANLVGFAWYLAVVGIGLAQAQRIPSGKAFAATLLPFGLFCLCCCFGVGVPLFAGLRQ